MSTSGRQEPVSLKTALLAGPAPDGGLYIPAQLPPLPDRISQRQPGRTLGQVAWEVAHHLLGSDLSLEELQSMVELSLDFPIPLVQVEDGLWALELFHGPTLAFKDVGARFMARLVSYFLDPGTDLTILVATSGDTGSAVAQAFNGCPGIKVVVLFPHGQVSELQQRQFTTLGGNVEAVAVHGSFDDCQRMVQQALADEKLRRDIPLASANSINIGRLLPQIFYYFHAVDQLPSRAGRPVFAVPSGNFGNLTAGLMARHLGLSCGRFVAATNTNDVVPVYLKTGRLRPQPSRSTLSSAMDVGNPSNVRRIRSLYGDSLEALRRDLTASSHTDQETRETIHDVHRRSGYLLDPHSAVAYGGLTGYLATQPSPRPAGILLATAHPAKFAPLMEEITGRPVPLPRRLAACLGRPQRILRMAARYDELKGFLAGSSL